MFTESLHTAIRAMKMALRLREPLHSLRFQITYGTMTICTLLSIIACVAIVRLLLLKYEGDYQNFMEIWGIIGPTLILMGTKFMYIFSGIVAAALGKRYSLLLIFEQNDNKPFFAGIPVKTWILCIIYIIAEVALYYCWATGNFRHAYIDAPNNGDMIIYWSLSIVHLLFDLLPLAAASHLYLSATTSKVENKWNKTIILMITGYAFSCILVCIFNLFSSIIIGFLTVFSTPLNILGVMGILFIYFLFSFAMPAFVLLTHCAFTETEDNYQLDFESEN